MKIWLRLSSAAMSGCMIALVACRAKPSPPGNAIPTASPASVALPGSNNAADAPNAPAVAQSASGALTLYTDPTSGVSFRYPSAWRPWHTGSEMYQPALAQNGGKVNITQVFDPRGTPFAKTNVVGLSFSYAARPASGADACAQSAQTAVSGGREAASEAINGVAFSRVEGGDAGMCHQMRTILNSTLHNGTCYLFERDFETICPEVHGAGNPAALTAAQTNALQQELDQVMQSVVLR